MLPGGDSVVSEGGILCGARPGLPDQERAGRGIDRAVSAALAGAGAGAV